MKYHFPEVTVLTPGPGFFLDILRKCRPSAGVSQKNFEVPESEAKLSFQGLTLVVPKAVSFTPEGASRYYTACFVSSLELQELSLPEHARCLKPAIRVTLVSGDPQPIELERVFTSFDMQLPDYRESHSIFGSTTTGLLDPREVGEKTPDQLLQIAYNGAMMREKLM